MDKILFPATAVRRQTEAVLAAWGMSAAVLDATVEALHWADLSGIDSHGIALLHYYSTMKLQGHVDFAAAPRELQRRGVTALVDAGTNLGHAAGTHAIDLACGLAVQAGVGAVAVRNSGHYGAAGYYADRAARKGFVGLSTSAVARPYVVPARGLEPVFGTNPLGVAAPVAGGEPFLLDMATSTGALGKVYLAQRRGARVPPGWAVDPCGRTETDPARIIADTRLTPLGAIDELAVHKGYGLAMLVEVLSTVLAGATWTMARPADPKADDVGHFFLAIDPRHFRPEGAFEADLAAMVARLHASPAADPALPVITPGVPEAEARERRAARGIPLQPMLLDQLRSITHEAGAPFLLDQQET